MDNFVPSTLFLDRIDLNLIYEEELKENSLLIPKFLEDLLKKGIENCGSDDCTINIWATYEGFLIETLTIHSFPVTCLTLSFDGRQVLSGSDSGFFLTDLSKLQNQHACYPENCGITCVAFSPVGDLYITADGRHNIKLRATYLDEVLQVYREHQDKITALEFAKDGSFFVSSSCDKAIKIWRKIEDFKFCLTHSLILHSRKVSSITISPDSEHILSCSEDKSVKLWSTEKGEFLNSFEGHLDAVNCVVFSPNGEFILSGSEDNSVKLWNLNCDTPIQSFIGHTEPMKSVVFSPNEDKSIKLRHIKNDEFDVKTYLGHTGTVNSIAFSPTGIFFASCLNDRRIIFWDVTKSAKIRDKFSLARLQMAGKLYITYH